jgi:triacylglycerol lipase
VLLRRLCAVLVLAVATVFGAALFPASASATTVQARNPVVILAGLSGPAIAYEPLAARLRTDGYQTFIYQLPNLGTGDIAASAQSFAGHLAGLRASTGASRFDLVGHSEGGLVARHYLKFLGGTAYVGRYVSLGSPQYGTYVANIADFLGLGNCIGIVACQQMTIGSTFLNNLNAGDDSPGAVRYTTVRTLQDELVRPTWNASIDGATNVLVQVYCPLRVVGHLGLVLDGTVYSVIADALADRAITPNCFAV